MHLLPAQVAPFVRFFIILLGSALTGWCAVALLLRLLFRPRRPVRLRGLTLQGVLYHRQGELAHAIGQMVERHLISQDNIVEMMERPEFQASLREAIKGKIADFLDNKLKQLNPMIGMLLGGSMRDKVEDLLTREILKLVPEMSARLVSQVDENFDLRQIVEERIRTFDMAHLEQAIFSSAGQEFRKIEFLGSLFGLAMGLAMAVLVWVV